MTIVVFRQSKLVFMDRVPLYYSADEILSNFGTPFFEYLLGEKDD